MKTVRAILLAGGVIATILGAGAGATAKEPLRFIFIAPCKDEAFFDPVKKGMMDAAKLMGVQCTWVGTEDVDLAAQAKMVQDAIDQNYDGIAVDMIDTRAFDAVAELAAKKGIPLVSFNTDDTTPNVRLSTVAQNLYEAGRALGKASAASISANSHVLITMHSAGVSALEDRARGMQDVLKDKQLKYTILVTGTSAEGSAKAVAEALKESPDIKAILDTGQADTEGAGLAVERGFKSRKIYIAGFDLSPETLRLIQSGIITFTIDQQPYIQGFYPVMQLALRCRYGIMPSNIDAGATIITKQTAGLVAELCKRGYR